MQAQTEIEVRQVRAAKNQSMFRAVNEEIEKLQSPNSGIDFACECADVDCHDAVTLGVAEYEEIRRSPTHFFVVEGHVLPEVERVVATGVGYVVVEKFGAASPVATAADPRQDATV
jgi:hypothetical protein